MKIRTQLILIFVLAFFALSLILSQNANPDFTPLYGLKRVQEKAFLSLKTNPKDRVDYMSALLDARLKEFENVIKNGSYSYLWSSSIRHSTFAGQITELITANNLKDMVGPAKLQFENHKNKLNELYVAYPKNTDNVEYKYILDAINYLNAYLQKLSQVK